MLSQVIGSDKTSLRTSEMPTQAGTQGVCLTVMVTVHSRGQQRSWSCGPGQPQRIHYHYKPLLASHHNRCVMRAEYLPRQHQPPATFCAVPDSPAT